MAERWQQWMPFHIDKFRGSPAVQAMHPCARLGYLYLLASAWQSQDCTLSPDASDLEIASGLGVELWAEYGARIVTKFGQNSDGRLFNAVLLVEWTEAKRVFEARRKSADRTNEVRKKASPSTVADTVTVQGPSRRADTHTQTGTGTDKANAPVVEEDRPAGVMVAREVMAELGISGMQLLATLADVCEDEMKKGADWQGLRKRMVTAGKRFAELSHRLYGNKPGEFFGNGIWRKPESQWPWKQGLEPPPAANGNGKKYWKPEH